MGLVNLIYRAPGTAFSIENVFDTIYDELLSEISIKRTYMKYHRANLRSILGNIEITHSSQECVNHVTGDVHYTMLGLDERNFNILTVHDLVPLEYLSGWKRAIAKHLWFTIPMKRANAITAISTKTAKELVALLPEVENKIHVIYDPVSPAFQQVPKQELSARPRLLHLGTKSNKNLERVIEAVSGLEATLVIIGILSPEIIRFLNSSNIDYENYSNLSQEKIIKEYVNCDIVLFPSLYEGFGLPIVEANSVGRPVITSNLEPMKEVSGESALLVDPSNVSEIRTAIHTLLVNKELRFSLIERGLKNRKRFLPSKITGEYLKLYKID